MNEGRIHAWTEQGSAASQQAGMTGISYSSAGFAIMFVMMMMLSMTGVLIEARQTGIWSRLFVSPVSRFQVMAGYFLSFFLVGWIQFSILIILSSVLFGVEWGDPVGLLFPYHFAVAMCRRLRDCDCKLSEDGRAAKRNWHIACHLHLHAWRCLLATQHRAGHHAENRQLRSADVGNGRRLRRSFRKEAE